jgi:excisionase family DNA binding protein
MSITSTGLGRQKRALQTLTVVEAGKLLGLSRDGSYYAAAKGHIPTIRIGRLIRVPVRALERMLDAAGEQPK